MFLGPIVRTWTPVGFSVRAGSVMLLGLLALGTWRANAQPSELPELVVVIGSSVLPTDAVLGLPDTRVGDTLVIDLRLENRGDQTVYFEGESMLTFDGPASFALLEAPQVMVIDPGEIAKVRLSFFPLRPWAYTAALEFRTLVPTESTPTGDFHLEFAGRGRVLDCNWNGVDDEIDLLNAFSADCDQNGVPDECDIELGHLADLDDNGVADLCDPDCNDNGYPDGYELLRGWENDCNLNGRPDRCDIASGDSLDLNHNGIPDECEADCNGNGIPDDLDIALGLSTDCNGNGIPDECELADGLLEDCDANGIADLCELDSDGDGIIDACDNCPSVYNPDQLDSNGDGTGDACAKKDDTTKPGDSDIPDDGGAPGDGGQPPGGDAGDGTTPPALGDDDGHGPEDLPPNNEDATLPDRMVEFPDELGCGGPLCGAGLAPLLPLMILGLGSWKVQRRRQAGASRPCR